eukprot:scaffold305_cov110-Cylindrotheca_fusiformis.AAC.29
MASDKESNDSIPPCQGRNAVERFDSTLSCDEALMTWWLIHSEKKKTSSILTTTFRNIQERQPHHLPPWQLQTFFSNPDGETETDPLILPNPDLDAVQVATICMDALQNQKPKVSLELCFAFSSDRCRAAVGGTLEEFLQYAANPVFGKLVHCENYEIASIGPIIPGSQVRGDMQTVLIEIRKATTVNDALSAVVKHQKNRIPIEERIRQKDAELRGEILPQASASGEQKKPTRFLWTMQKERRPPRQNCWLVHEVLFVNNAYQQTL